LKEETLKEKAQRTALKTSAFFLIPSSFRIGRICITSFKAFVWILAEK